MGDVTCFVEGDETLGGVEGDGGVLGFGGEGSEAEAAGEAIEVLGGEGNGEGPRGEVLGEDF